MSSEQDTLKLAAEIVDKFSGPLRQMTKSVHGFQDMLKGAHTEGSKRSKEQLKQQVDLNKGFLETSRTILGSINPAFAEMSLGIGSATGVVAGFITKLKEQADGFYKVQGAMQATGMSAAGLQTWTGTMESIGVSADAARASAMAMGDTLAKLGRGSSPEIQRLSSTFTNLGPLIANMRRATDQGQRMKEFWDFYMSHPAPPDQRRKLLEAFGLPVEIATLSYDQLKKLQLRQQLFSREHPPISPDDLEAAHEGFEEIGLALQGVEVDMIKAFGPATAGLLKDFAIGIEHNVADIKQMAAEWSAFAKTVVDFDDRFSNRVKHALGLDGAPPKVVEPLGAQTVPSGAYGNWSPAQKLAAGMQPVSFTSGGSSDPENMLTRGVKTGMLAAFREWFASTVSPSGGGGGAGAINASYSPGGGGGGSAPRFGSKAFPNLGEGGAAAAKRLGLGADPGAGLTGNAYLKAQNKSMADELARDPQTRRELAAMAATEGDAGNVVEALANRKAYLDQATGTNHSVHSLLHSGFYGPINRGALPGAMASLARNPKRAAQINAAIDSVLEGRHNALRGATDQGLPTDPNGRWPGGRVTGLDQIYNDWGGGPGGHAGAARFRERQQAAVNAAVASATPHDSFGPLADISGRMPDIRHAGGGFTPVERNLLKTQNEAQRHVVEGDASVNVKFENLPAGARAQLWHGGMFKSGTVDWGHAMPSSDPGGPPSPPISR
jgi:hypothetical protein